MYEDSHLEMDYEDRHFDMVSEVYGEVEDHIAFPTCANCKQEYEECVCEEEYEDE